MSPSVVSERSWRSSIATASGRTFATAAAVRTVASGAGLAFLPLTTCSDTAWTIWGLGRSTLARRTTGRARWAGRGGRRGGGSHGVRLHDDGGGLRGTSSAAVWTALSAGPRVTSSEASCASSPTNWPATGAVSASVSPFHFSSWTRLARVSNSVSSARMSRCAAAMRPLTSSSFLRSAATCKETR